jgi:hypothetical protein
MIILLLNFKRNKILYEHLTEDNELTDIERNLLTNIVYKYKYNNLTLDNISFRNANTNNLTINKEDYILQKIQLLNKLNTKNLNITNDISMNNLTVSNNLSANTFFTNNIQSETATFNTVNGEIFAENIISSELNTDKFCIDSSCITTDQYINVKRKTDPQNKYIYNQNSPDKIDQLIIWDDLKDKIINNRTDGVIRAVGTTMVMTHQVGGIYGPWPITSDKKGVTGAKNIYTTSTRKTSEKLGIGLEIIIPDKPDDMIGDFTVLWVQTIADRYNSFRVYELEGSNIKKDFGSHVTGTEINKYILNTISPDGTVNQLTNNADGIQYFTWWPVPIDLTGNTSRKLMISFNMDNHTRTDYTDPWFSGFAFSKNPWNHCPINHVSIHWDVNRSNTSDLKNQNPNIMHATDAFFTYSFFKNNTITQFRIPFVNSGKDKIFYIIEYNMASSPSFKNLEIVTTPAKAATLAIYKDLGGFYTTFKNPFSEHYNSRVNQRYYAVIIPKQFLPPKNPMGDFIDLQLNVRGSYGQGSSFTEVGTHDLYPL